MKKFIFRSLVLGGVLFLLLCIADFGISNVLRNSNGPRGEGQVWNDIYQGNVNADLAIYGSSRAWVQISPSILKDTLDVNVYNFGLNGHSFWLQYLRHIEYLKYNEKPSTIVLSVDVFSLAKRKDLYLYEQFLPNMLWNNNIKHYTQSFLGFETIDYFVPLLRYKGEFDFIKKTYKKRHRAPLRHLGYKGIDEKWDSLLEKKRAENKNYKSAIDMGTMELFYKFIEECNKKDIHLIFVYAPEHITGQNFVQNRDEIIHIFEEAATQNNIPILTILLILTGLIFIMPHI